MMSGQTSFEQGRMLLRMNAERQDRPSSFALFGREWDLVPGVFAPVYCYSTQLFTSWLPYPAGGSLLEIGSGAGVMAVTAALRGCAEVTAVDVSRAAVHNSRLNVARHEVGDRVRVLHSDLFSALGKDERFDVIFFNSNFIESAPEHVDESELAGAIFDPGYATHREFIRSAPAHLKPGGRLLLGFSNLGNRELLAAIAGEAGLSVTEFQSAEPTAGMRYEMLEIVRAGVRHG